MHEFSVTQAALEAALAKAEERDAARITDVHLAIGRVSSIKPGSIRMYWADISGGTIAKDAALHFRRVPTECFCADCGHRLMVEGEPPHCPACKAESVRAVDDEFLGLEGIDIEKLPMETALE